MADFFFFSVLAQGILIGFLCAYVAGQKNRGRGNWFILGFLFSVLALIALAAIPSLPPLSTKGPWPAPQVHAGKSTFLGVCDLASDEYKIWLTDHYGITKNDALNGIVCDKRIFPTIDFALAHAHSLYASELAVLKSKEPPATGIDGAVFWLRSNGFVADSLGEEKWMVASRAKRVIVYPSSNAELIRFAQEKSGRSFGLGDA